MNSLLIKRPAAYAIDFLLVASLCVLPQLLVYMLFNGVPFDYFDKAWQVYGWVLLTVSLPVWLYFILQESSSRQSTFGKRIMKVRVITTDNHRISRSKSFQRTAVKLLPWELAHLGLLPIYFSDSPEISIGLYLSNALIIIYIIYFILHRGTKAIHDTLAGTIVKINS